MKIKLTSTSKFKKTTTYLHKLNRGINDSIFRKYGDMGVVALSKATPVDSGLTASSWKYEIIKKRGSVQLQFINSNVSNFVNIAIILQYGHATGNGGWVSGTDYINPALKPVFEKLAKDLAMEVRA